LCDFNLNELRAILKRDTELLSRIASWDSDPAKVYIKYLPAFEVFLKKIPDDITVSELESVLRKQPVDFRLLFAIRMTQMYERLNAGKVSLNCKGLGQFLRRELYENNPEKINISHLF